MNTELFYYSLVEIGISIVIGVSLLYFTYRVINKLVMKKFDINSDNVSFSIFTSSILFSVAYLISGIKSPILNSLKMLSNNPEYEGSLILDGFKYSGLFLSLIIITITLVIFISIKLFTYMTKNINEFQEIKKNNLAVAILTATIIISISLLVKESLYLLLETFVPYPDVPKIF
tara:strand:- start:129 stop:650 length:522 start_codon:yes stop_codon:yes gene_type:complete